MSGTTGITCIKKHQEQVAIQNGDTWKNHFEQLYSEIKMNPEQTPKYENNIHMEHSIGKYQNLLDYPYYRKLTD